MKPALLAPVALLALSAACSMNTPGTVGSPAVSRPAMTGTIFTIVFENHDEGAVLNPANMPYLLELSQQYASAESYQGSVHPSLPNYIQMISGDTFGIRDDLDPAAHPLASHDNLADQLDTAHVPWRAYMESMGNPCGMTNSGQYAARHNPFVYFTSVSGDTARCNEHVVDFEQNFATDLAANQQRYMWITPNVCNDMHDCPPSTSDAWLRRVIPQIMASPGYQNGGAIFVLWDEGSANLSYLTGQPQNLAAVVISPHLVSAGYRSTVEFNHNSYLATVEDMLGLPRLPTTTSATPMGDFFNSMPESTTAGATGSATGGASGATAGAASGATPPAGM